MADDPYRAWVEGFAAALREGAAIGLPEVSPAAPHADGPAALLFSPHPDDEVIVAGLALRLRREAGMRVVNVAVTLGSDAGRREARRGELAAACDYLGFDLVAMGLEGVNPDKRAADPARWAASVRAMAEVLEAEKPRVVFLPHAADWNVTHVGVHQLVVEAMRLVAGLRCLAVETEYWAAMGAPNLMIESSAADVATLVAGLSLHVGEVTRNAYHLRLPAWMIDNVRRGAELVGGQGGAAPAFAFATLYRLLGWRDGFYAVLDRGRSVGSQESLGFVAWR